MKDIKLIATDLDGTLLDGAAQVGDDVIETVRLLRERGVEVAIATGRMFCSASRIAAKLDIDAPIICYNGAMVRRMGSGEMLSHQHLTAEHAEKIIDIYEKYAPKGTVCHVYINDEMYIPFANERSERYIAKHCCKTHIEPDLKSLITKVGAPTKILFWCDEDQMADLRKTAEDVMNGEVFITQSCAFFLEFVSLKAGKGNGVKFLADMLGVTKEQTMCLGDNLNDLPLYQAGGLNVALGNAVDELKEQADFVSKRNDEQGWSYAVRTLLNL